jgi:hypothetical protein
VYPDFETGTPLDQVKAPTFELRLADWASESKLTGAFVAEMQPAVPAVKVENLSTAALGAG